MPFCPFLGSEKPLPAKKGMSEPQNVSLSAAEMKFWKTAKMRPPNSTETRFFRSETKPRFSLNEGPKNGILPKTFRHEPHFSRSASAF